MMLSMKKTHPYLELLKHLLIGLFSRDIDNMIVSDRLLSDCPDHIRQWLTENNLSLVRNRQCDIQMRREGRDWPRDAETMIGLQRLQNIENCIFDILKHEVAGDLLEAGVWRGGAAIFMKAVLTCYQDYERKVWLADSFNGVPRPNENLFPLDNPSTPWGRLWMAEELAVPVEVVKRNFARYGLLDDRVCFLQGWFRDTLPSAPVEQLALLRLDGDLYESTIISLRHLYPKVSLGGYVIIDDYGAISACRQAVDDYRKECMINEPLQWIDWTGVFWKVVKKNDDYKIQI